MADPLRILTVFGTRPEAIKLFPLLHALSTDSRCDSRICVSGQHRGMLDQVLAMSGVQPDHDLDLMQPGQTLDEQTARLLPALGKVMDRERPDRVVVQGDTATAMTGALAAYYRRIPVIHVEAGLRSGNIHHPWPEEINRRIIGSIAALHCAPTARAAQALLDEGVDPDIVHVTGNTVIDALHWITGRIASRPELAGGIARLEQRFAGKRIIIVTCHRRENLGAGMAAIAAAITRLAEREDVALIFPVHPNPEVREAMHARLQGIANVALVDPLDYPHFARLLAISTLVLTDSGGVQEEAAALGKPVLVMRETTERPEGVAAGIARLVGADTARIVAETARLLDDRCAYARMAAARNPYGDGNSARRIADLLVSGKQSADPVNASS